MQRFAALRRKNNHFFFIFCKTSSREASALAGYFLTEGKMILLITFQKHKKKKCIDRDSNPSLGVGNA